MTDDELRRFLREAHAGDDPPDFRAQLARARTRRAPRRRFLLLAPAAVAVALVLFWSRRPTPPAAVDLRWSEPLAFLLEVPGADLLRDTPRFELKGMIP